MKRRGWIIAAAVVAGVIAVTASSAFIVGQDDQVVLSEFGKPAGVINAAGDAPGLKFKPPWATATHLDRRGQAFEASAVTVTASEGTPYSVIAFLRYRIAEPAAFLIAAPDEDARRSRLEALVGQGLREGLSNARDDDIRLTGSDAWAKAKAAIAAHAAQAHMGVAVLDLSAARVLPAAPLDQAIYKRMQTALEQQAAQVRAQGDAAKARIATTADHEVSSIQTDAKAEADNLIAQGDAERAAIFQKSFGQDPGFADFYNSMRVYDQTLAQGDTTLVLSPNSPLLKYLKHGPNGK